MEITFVISKLGYGHLTRQFALADQIHSINKNINFQFIVSEDHKGVFMRKFKMLNATVNSSFFTPGFVMDNTDSVDVDSTLYSFQMAIDFDTQVRDDTNWGRVLESSDLLINDIEFFHNPIARKMGIPIVNISNFTWSDVLKPIAKASLIQKVMEFESFSDYNFKLPFSTECDSFGNNYEEVGLLVREFDQMKVEQIEKQFDSSKPIVLITSLPASIDFNHKTITKLADRYHLILTHGVKLQKVNPTLIQLPLNVPDLHNYIKAADLVIGKTGYGIISECAYSLTPLLHWTRNNYLEDSVLSKAIQNINLGEKLETLNVDVIDEQINKVTSFPKQFRNSSNKIAERILSII